MGPSGQTSLNKEACEGQTVLAERLEVFGVSGPDIIDLSQIPFNLELDEAKHMECLKGESVDRDYHYHNKLLLLP